MCGFAGIYPFTSLSEAELQLRTAAMIATIPHRGPDELKTLVLPFAAVGFRRLSIVDLATGGQPVQNRDGTVQVFLNGEIYNHGELRDRLRREHGIDVRGGSDAAVLPHLFECYGESFVDQLNGMFAICVLDHRDRSMRLYRDRLGIKPIYVATTRDAFVFGSELKPIWSSGFLPAALDERQLLPFLDLFYVPGVRTLARGIDKLMPGEMVRVDGNGARTKRYWSLATPRELRRGDVLDELDALLQDATRLQLMADVPIGISLSGGLDSSLISYWANAGEANVTAYTIAFPDTDSEELSSARLVAAALKIEHVVLEAEPTDFLAELDRTIRFNDEPVADPAFMPALQVAKKASEHVRVLLSGCGSDELFAGYGHHTLTRRAKIFRLLHRFCGDALADVLSGKRRSKERRAALRAFGRDRLPLHALAMTHLRPEDRAALGGTGDDPLAEMRQAFADAAWMDGRNRQLYVDSVTYLPHQLLSLLDRTTMGASVEGRVPFLDHRVAELAMAIHGGTKFRGERGNKWLLRELAHRHLPRAIAERKKLGFPNQIHSSLAPARLPAVRDRLLAPGGLARTRFPAPWLEGMLRDAASLEQNELTVHSLLVLDAWHRGYVEQRPATPDATPVEPVAVLS